MWKEGGTILQEPEAVSTVAGTAQVMAWQDNDRTEHSRQVHFGGLIQTLPSRLLLETTDGLLTT